MSPTTYMVVGASRGIGKGLVEHLSHDPSTHVFATTRKPIDFGAPNIENIVLETTDASSVRAAATKIKKLDVLILNAAIGDQEWLLTTSADRLQKYVDTNIVGTHRVVNAFVPALRAGQEKKIIIISSRDGSIAMAQKNDFGFRGPYALTKAANNMQALLLHRELRNEGFKVIPLHPGWVSTDMGNIYVPDETKPVPEEARGMKPIPVETAVTSIVERIQDLTHEQSGQYMSYDGTQLPW